MREVVTVTDEKKVITTRPDGTKVIVVERHTEKQSETNVKIDKKIDARPNWSVGAYSTLDTKRFVVTLDRRVIGNLYVGVYGRAEIGKPAFEAGVGLRYSF